MTELMKFLEPANDLTQRDLGEAIDELMEMYRRKFGTSPISEMAGLAWVGGNFDAVLAEYYPDLRSAMADRYDY